MTTVGYVENVTIPAQLNRTEFSHINDTHDDIMMTNPNSTADIMVTTESVHIENATLPSMDNQSDPADILNTQGLEGTTQGSMDTISTLQVLYCIVLYCIVLYCIVLHCIVLYCIVLYCTTMYCIVMYCIVLCNVLYCFVYCIVLY